MTTARAPVPFEVYQPGVYLHGTKADLAVGEVLVPGRESNFERGRVMKYIYFTATLDAATWGAELAARNLNELLRNAVDPTTRYLVRSVKGEARGWLSDRFRRLDCRPNRVQKDPPLNGRGPAF